MTRSLPRRFSQTLRLVALLTMAPACKNSDRSVYAAPSTVTYKGTSPFKSAGLRVYPIGHSDQTALTSTADENGAWSFELTEGPGAYAVELAGDSARVSSLVATDLRGVGQARLLLYIDHAPGSAAKTVSGLAANFLTTVAVHTCEARLARFASASDSCRDAHRLWAAHVNNGQDFDFRVLDVAPFDETLAGKDRQTQIVSLVHYALDYLGADLALADARERGSIAWYSFLPYLERDQAHDPIDGIGDAGPVQLTRKYALVTNTLRSGLAKAWLQLLNEVPLPDGTTVANKTGLTSQQFSDELTYMVEDASNLFAADFIDTLDLAPPSITSATTLPTYLSGTVTLCVQTSDSADAVTSGGIEGPGGPLANITLTSGKLCGDLDTTKLADGALSGPITYWVVDDTGNRATGQLAGVATVDNGGPGIDQVLPAPGPSPKLSGTITFSITSATATAVRMVSPTPLDFALVNGTWQASWDSTVVPDSDALDIVIDATDANGVHGRRSFVYAVDNYDPGQLQFCAFADAPLVSAQVQACWMQTGGSCTPYALASPVVTDANGCATLALPDTQSGWLRVSTTGGSYPSASATDSSGTPLAVLVPADRGVHATFKYAPGRPATVLSNRSINFATTLADAWASTRLTASTPLDSILQHSSDLLGNHVGRGLTQGLDVRSTYVRDLVGSTTHAQLTSEESTRMGLFQVGLAQCATEWALANGSPAESLPSYTLLSLLETKDAANGFFDGFDNNNVAIAVANHALDQNTLRFTLASCAALWLGTGRRGLLPSQFSQRTGFFSLLSTNEDRELFGPNASTYTVFDQIPPVVKQFTVVDGLRAPLRLNPIPNVPPVFVRVWATDDSGFTAADGTPFLPQLQLTPGPAAALQLYDRPSLTTTDLDALYVIDLTGITEGAQHVTMSVRDAASDKNVTTATLDFTVDKTPPKFTSFSAPARTNTTDVNVSWTLDEAASALQLLYDGVAQQVAISPTATSLKATLPACNRTTQVSLRATDLAGNTGMPASPASVACDNTPPVVALFGPARTGSATALALSWTTNEPLEMVEIFDGVVDAAPPVKVVINPTSTTVAADASPCGRTIDLTLRATDLFGNTGLSAPVAIICDNTPPSLTTFSLVSAHVQSASVGVTWATDEALSTLELLVDGTVANTQNSPTPNSGTVFGPLPTCNANHAVTLRATDLVGNATTTAQALTVNCDNIAPTVTQSATARTNSLSVSVSWGANEPVQYFEVFLDGFSKGQFSGTSTGGTIDLGSCNRTAQILVSAKDLAGNAGTATAPSFVICDNTPPVLTLSTPARVNAATGAAVPVSWTTNEPLQKIEVFVGAVGATPAVAILTNPTTSSTNVNLGACDVTTTLNLRGTDLAGNAAVAPPFTIVCDATPPTATAFALTARYVTSPTVGVQWGSSEALSKIELLVSGTAVQTQNSPVGTAGTIYGPLPACDLSFAIGLRLTDLVGNAFTTPVASQLTATCDATSPTLTVNALPAKVGAPTVLVSGTASDGGAGVAQVTISAGSGYLKSITPVTPQPQVAFSENVAIGCDTTLVPAIQISATDGVNWNTTRQYTVLCDSTPPQLLLDRDPAITYVPASSVAVSLNATGTGLAYTLGAPLSLVDTFWNGVPVLEQHIQRLDYLPAQGVTAASNNLPQIKFHVFDCTTTNQVCTAPAGLVSEYRYLANGIQVRGWTTLAPYATDPVVFPGTYLLPLSYQTIDPSLGTTTTAVVHTIELRATDDVGHASVAAVNFRLTPFAPPLWLSTCQIDQAGLSAYGLANDRFHLLFGPAPTARAWTGGAKFLLDAPVGSLVPNDTLRIARGTAPRITFATASRVETMSQQCVSFSYNTALADPSCLADSTDWKPGWGFGVCTAGDPYASATTVLPHGTTGGPVGTAGSVLGVADGVTPIAPDATGTFQLPPSANYRFELYVNEPSMTTATGIAAAYAGTQYHDPLGNLYVVDLFDYRLFENSPAALYWALRDLYIYHWIEREDVTVPQPSFSPVFGANGLVVPVQMGASCAASFTMSLFESMSTPSLTRPPVGVFPCP